MKTRILAAILIATGPMVFGNSASASDAHKPAGCVEPVPQRNYESDVLSYALAVDYTNCAWWHDTPIVLEASLSRLDGQGESAAGSLSLCAHALRATPNGDGQSETGEAQGTPAPTGEPGIEGATRDGTCNALVWMEHPPVEAALYRGQVTYPWEGGDRTVGFTALCGPNVGCVDLPADPSPALGTASDVYDAIAGGDDSAD